MKNKCNAKKQKSRHHITLALDGAVWSKFQPALKERWEGSFTSWVEYAMTCYMQETCDDCPYADEENIGKGFKPTGIGENSNE